MRVKADMGIRQQKPEDTIDYPEATKASLGQTFLSWFREDQGPASTVILAL